MYYADLSQECQLGRGPDIRAVGWLDHQHPYTRGAVPKDFLETLTQHVHTAWQPVVSWGIHACELCQGKTLGTGSNVWIPTSRVVYIAPAMITHYIEVHGYQPPDEFVAAVMACPAQDSVEYRQAIQSYLYHWVG